MGTVLHAAATAPVANGLSGVRPSQTEGTAKTQQTGSTAATIKTSTSTVNVSMVHVQVNEMLGAIGGGKMEVSGRRLARLSVACRSNRLSWIVI